MKVILLVEKDLGLARKRPAGAEIDVDPETGNAWIAAGEARLSEKELIEQASAAKKTIISKPAKSAPGDNAPDAKA